MDRWLLMRIKLLIPAEKPAQDGLLVLAGLPAWLPWSVGWF